MKVSSKILHNSEISLEFTSIKVGVSKKYILKGFSLENKLKFSSLIRVKHSLKHFSQAAIFPMFLFLYFLKNYRILFLI